MTITTYFALVASYIIDVDILCSRSLFIAVRITIEFEPILFRFASTQVCFIDLCVLWKLFVRFQAARLIGTVFEDHITLVILKLAQG